MPIHSWLTRRSHDWIGRRYLLTWMGVVLDYAALSGFISPASWHAVLRLRISIGPVKLDDGWPGLLDFDLPPTRRGYGYSSWPERWLTAAVG